MVQANDTIHNIRSNGAAVTHVSHVSDTIVAVMVDSIVVVVVAVAVVVVVVVMPARFD